MLFGLLVILVRIIDFSRGDRVIWHGRLPTGEATFLTRATMRHIEGRRRTITRLKIVQCLTDPEEIYKDLRPNYAPRGHLYATRHKMSPYGPRKSKRFTVHLKPCRKLWVLPVMYVSTAIEAVKLPPGGVLSWQKEKGASEE